MKFEGAKELIGNRPWVVTAGSGKNKEVYLSENWDEVDPADKKILERMNVEYHQEDEQGRAVFTAEKTVAQYRFDKINRDLIEEKQEERELRRMPENWPFLLKIPLNIGVLIAKLFLLAIGYLFVGIAIAGNFLNIILKVILGMAIIVCIYFIATDPGAEGTKGAIVLTIITCAVYFLPNLFAKIGNFMVDLGTCLVFF